MPSRGHERNNAASVFILNRREREREREAKGSGAEQSWGTFLCACCCPKDEREEGGGGPFLLRGREREGEKCIKT